MADELRGKSTRRRTASCADIASGQVSESDARARGAVRACGFWRVNSVTGTREASRAMVRVFRISRTADLLMHCDPAITRGTRTSRQNQSTQAWEPEGWRLLFLVP